MHLRKFFYSSFWKLRLWSLKAYSIMAITRSRSRYSCSVSPLLIRLTILRICKCHFWRSPPFPLINGIIFAAIFSWCFVRKYVIPSLDSKNWARSMLNRLYACRKNSWAKISWSDVSKSLRYAWGYSNTFKSSNSSLSPAFGAFSSFFSLLGS